MFLPLLLWGAEAVCVHINCRDAGCGSVDVDELYIRCLVAPACGAVHRAAPTCIAHSLSSNTCSFCPLEWLVASWRTTATVPLLLPSQANIWLCCFFPVGSYRNLSLWSTVGKGMQTEPYPQWHWAVCGLLKA